MVFYNHLPQWYSKWETANPAYGQKYKIYKVKKPVYNTNFTPPTTTSEKVNGLLKNNLAGVKYLGTIRTMDKHLNCNIYEGLSNAILDTGNAGCYPGFNLDKGNSTIAAHTYSVLGWHFYDGFTMMQLELNKGDHVYIYNGNDKYYDYTVMDKQIIDARTGGYITDPKRSDDKKVNPTGAPMLTMFDCYEPTNGTYIEEPTQRNVAFLHQEHVYTKSDAPSKIKKLFEGLPTYIYKDNKVKVKDAPKSKDMWWLDFLFETLKVQKIIHIK